MYANLVVRGFNKNSIFDLSPSINRDNCLYPWWLLREKFKAHGIQLNTADVNGSRPVGFELHVDVQERKTFLPTYLLLVETPQIWPNNSSEHHLSQYRGIFSWNDSLVDSKRYIKYHLPVPNQPSPPFSLGWGARDRLCCMIAGNKAVARRHPQELYSKRVETIQWFERHAPEDFDLYGQGWYNAPAQPGKLGRLCARFSSGLYLLTRKQPFPSYRGSVINKHDILSQYRFSICYENVCGVPGYITEKLFDCFFAGCVPIYWGASNILDYVPEDCFIDRRQFSDHEGLYNCIRSMSEADYIAYQSAIQIFLKSSNAALFYPDKFASTIVGVILADINGVT